MPKYVCGFMMNEDEVILIHKTHPREQAGRWNGIGGKIRTGHYENPLTAMNREWRKETGDTTSHQWRPFARLKFSGGEVHFFVCIERVLPKITDTSDEHVDVFPLVNLVYQPLVEYVDWLIPLARASQSLSRIVELEQAA